MLREIETKNVPPDSSSDEVDKVMWESPLARRILGQLPEAVEYTDLLRTQKEQLLELSDFMRRPLYTEQQQSSVLSPVKLRKPSVDTAYEKSVGMKYETTTAAGTISSIITEPQLAGKLFLDPLRSALIQVVEVIRFPLTDRAVNEMAYAKLLKLIYLLCCAMEEFRGTYKCLPFPLDHISSSPPIEPTTHSNDSTAPSINMEHLIVYVISKPGLGLEMHEKVVQVLRGLLEMEQATPVSMLTHAAHSVQVVSDDEGDQCLRLTPTIPGGTQCSYEFVEQYMRPPVLQLHFPVDDDDEEISQKMSTNPKSRIKYKTILCSQFEMFGFCNKNDKCEFAHGRQELRSVNEHRKFRTRYCRNQENCKYGKDCMFIHK